MHMSDFVPCDISTQVRVTRTKDGAPRLDDGAAATDGALALAMRSISERVPQQFDFAVRVADGGPPPTQQALPAAIDAAVWDALHAAAHDAARARQHARRKHAIAISALRTAAAAARLIGSKRAWALPLESPSRVWGPADGEMGG